MRLTAQTLNLEFPMAWLMQGLVMISYDGFEDIQMTDRHTTTYQQDKHTTSFLQQAVGKYQFTHWYEKIFFLPNYTCCTLNMEEQSDTILRTLHTKLSTHRYLFQSQIARISVILAKFAQTSVFLYKNNRKRMTNISI